MVLKAMEYLTRVVKHRIACLRIAATVIRDSYTGLGKQELVRGSRYSGGVLDRGIRYFSRYIEHQDGF